MSDIEIGLFGTCGKSTWRKPFIDKYTAEGIAFFNPQVADGTWSPGCVDAENRHLQEDDIILFPITSETAGFGSLAEIGFSLRGALRRSPDRYFIYLIDDTCDDPDITGGQRLESNRTRLLVKSKLLLESRRNSGIFLVKNLQDMLDLSVQLYYNIEQQFKLQLRYGTNEKWPN